MWTFRDFNKWLVKDSFISRQSYVKISVVTAWKKPRKTCMLSAPLPTLDSNAQCPKKRPRNSRVSVSLLIFVGSPVLKVVLRDEPFHCRITRSSLGVARFLYRCQEQRLWRLGFYPFSLSYIIIRFLMNMVFSVWKYHSRIRSFFSLVLLLLIFRWQVYKWGDNSIQISSLWTKETKGNKIWK